MSDSKKRKASKDPVKVARPKTDSSKPSGKSIAASPFADFGGRAKDVPLKVSQGRIRELRKGSLKDGPVIYWMSRDQRSVDNWALIYAVQKAQERQVPVAIAFNLVSSFLGAGARQFGFMLRGLQAMQAHLKELGIPFFLFQGVAEQTIPAFCLSSRASLLVTDFSPLRIGRHWRQAVCASLADMENERDGEGGGGGDVSSEFGLVGVHEVDAHNVVPVWVASDKLEYAARTIRTKIHRNLPEYLVEFPTLSAADVIPWSGDPPPAIDWEQIIAAAVSAGQSVPEVDWISPGQDAALRALSLFLSSSRIRAYDSDRNDPSKGPLCLSGLSPWLHFGQLAPQRAALAAREKRKENAKAVDSFLEELVVRRELADNFCFHQPQYDSLEGAWSWAHTTLNDHRNDKREFVYSKEQLEKAQTYDQLWNASQLEMVYYGKMHGYMRMYWAKKILEWTKSPEDALSIAIYLNDKYELDGRDPSGYVGCMWSIAGVHDQGWAERPVFGKVRYMNAAGCKRKFDVDRYISYVSQMVRQVKMKVKSKEQGSGSATAKTAATKP